LLGDFVSGVIGHNYTKAVIFPSQQLKLSYILKGIMSIFCSFAV